MSQFLFQNLLSRKSSASSTGSLEKPFSVSVNSAETFTTEVSKMTRKNLLRHDEHSIKSVKDKIALFSTSKSGEAGGCLMHHQSSEDVASGTSCNQLAMARLNSAGFLTRAYTHGDVRFDGSKLHSFNPNPRCGMNARNAAGAGDKSVSSADLTFEEAAGVNSGADRTRMSGLSNKSSHPPHGRSQSLMEIGSVTVAMGMPEAQPRTQTLPKRHCGQQLPMRENHQQRRRNTVAKIKDIVIPESHYEVPSGLMKDEDAAEWVVAGAPDRKYSKSSYANVPGNKRENARSVRSPPVSPIGKQLSSQQGSRTSLASPTGGMPLVREESATRLYKKQSVTGELSASRRSSNVSNSSNGSSVMEAITRHRMDSQHMRKKTSISEFRAIEARELGGRSTNSPQPITSLGKPASRSSSFTIAERKKSFESMAKGSNMNNNNNNLVTVGNKKIVCNSPYRLPRHSSQDSLAMRRSSRDTLMESNNNFSSVSSVASNASRRSSRDTIGEETAFAVGIEYPPPPPAFNSSRRSSRSEADGGSRVTTPTKVLSSNASSVDRSASVTPTERRGSNIVCNNLSRADSVISEVSSSPEQPLKSQATTSEQSNPKTSSGIGYVRSTSIVSKDSGFTDEEAATSNQHPQQLQLQQQPQQQEKVSKDRWTALEKKYGPHIAPKTDRPKDLSIDLSPSSKKSSSVISPESAAKSIRELTEKFEKCSPDSTVTSPATLATTAPALTPQAEEFEEQTSVTKSVEVVMTSAASSRKESLVTHSNVEEYCSASFRLGEQANVHNFSWLEESLALTNKPFFYLPEESTEWESFDPGETDFSNFSRMPVTSSPAPAPREKLRKYSVPVYPNGKEDKQDTGQAAAGGADDVKLRDKKDINMAPSRPSSLVETTSLEVKVFEMGHLGDREHRANTVLSSSTNSRGSSQADLLSDAGCSASQHGDPAMNLADPRLKSPQPAGAASASSPMSTSFRSGVEGCSSSSAISMGKDDPNRRCVSVHDIRRAFEKAEQSLSQSIAASSDCGSGGSPASGPALKVGKAGSSSSSSGGFGSAPSHNRMSSLDSTTSDESSIPTPHYYGSVSSLLSGQANNVKDHYGSISSLASSTSLISPQVRNCFLLPVLRSFNISYIITLKMCGLY